MLRAQRYLGSKGNRVFIICLATIVALLMLLLTACGSNVGGQGQATTPHLLPLCKYRNAVQCIYYTHKSLLLI